MCSPTNNSLIFPASHIAQLFPKLVTIVTFGPSNAPLACLTWSANGTWFVMKPSARKGAKSRGCDFDFFFWSSSFVRLGARAASPLVIDISGVYLSYLCRVSIVRWLVKDPLSPVLAVHVKWIDMPHNYYFLAATRSTVLNFLDHVKGFCGSRENHFRLRPARFSESLMN